MVCYYPCNIVHLYSRSYKHKTTCCECCKLQGTFALFSSLSTWEKVTTPHSTPILRRPPNASYQPRTLFLHNYWRVLGLTASRRARNTLPHSWTTPQWTKYIRDISPMRDGERAEKKRKVTIRQRTKTISPPARVNGFSCTHQSLIQIDHILHHRKKKCIKNMN